MYAVLDYNDGTSLTYTPTSTLMDSPTPVTLDSNASSLDDNMSSDNGNGNVVIDGDQTSNESSGASITAFIRVASLCYFTMAWLV
jgi:hypothetical protein